MKCVVCGKSRFEILFVHHHGWRVGKCLNCSLVQVVPMPGECEISSLYHEDMEHFEPYIAQLSVHRQYFRKKISEIGVIASAHQRFSDNSNDAMIHRRIDPLHLLDVGCAMGVLLEEAKKQGLDPVGVDISADAVSYCKKRGLVAYEGTIQTAGKKLRQNSFDVVTVFEIIEHERDPLGMMRRVHQLLNTGGIAVLTTPNHSSFWRKIMGKWWFGYQHPEHVTFWDPQSLTVLLERSGFKNISVRHDQPRPFPLSFAFTRSADYFPWLAWLLHPVGRFLDRFNIRNPVNPWDDLIVIGKK